MEQIITMAELKAETSMLLQLIQIALCQAEDVLEWDKSCNIPSLSELIIKQSLVPMLYPTIHLQTGTEWETLDKNLKPVYEREIHRGLIQEYEIQALLDDMERDGIDCLPLKGWVMRNYYPEPLMRSMSDLDVLIKDMDSLKIKKWMQIREYTPEHVEQYVHDTYIKPPYMNIELHRRLMEENILEQKHIAWRESWLASLWKKECRLEGKEHLYCFSDEDFLIYHILHFYKHFTNSGVGIRPLVDLYLFLQEKQQALNWKYVQQQLGALHISQFCKKMIHLAAKCFKGQKLNESEQLVVEYLTETGVYGDLATTETAYLLKEAGENIGRARRSSFLRRCFPSIEIMKNIYPQLRHMVWALPFYWMWRVGRIVFLEPYKLSAVRKYQTQDRYNNLKQIYHAAGIIGE